jgi:hypothetical protein
MSINLKYHYRLTNYFLSHSSHVDLMYTRDRQNVRLYATLSQHPEAGRHPSQGSHEASNIPKVVGGNVPSESLLRCKVEGFREWLCYCARRRDMKEDLEGGAKTVLSVRYTFPLLPDVGPRLTLSMQ